MTRMKTPAITVPAPQNIQEATALMRQLGELDSQIKRIEADLNDAIGALKEKAGTEVDPLKQRIKEITTAMQAWASANRNSLTEGGKRKSFQLATGWIMWRNRPPSVGVRGKESVIQVLLERGLERFLHTTYEINKEAILAAEDRVEITSQVRGLTLKTGIEDFVLEPYKVELCK